MKRRKSSTKKALRKTTKAVGTWPTPDKPFSKKKVVARKTVKKASSRRGKRRTSPRSIDSVPLPDKPRHKPRRKKMK